MIEFLPSLVNDPLPDTPIDITPDTDHIARWQHRG